MEEHEAPEPFITDFKCWMYPLRYEGKVGLAIRPDDGEPFTIVFDVESVHRMAARASEQLHLEETPR